MALYEQDVARNNGTPNYQQLKTAVKLHVDQMMGNRNFKARKRCCGKGFSYQESKRKQILLRGKWESVFSGNHKDSVPKEIPVVSVMTLC